MGDVRATLFVDVTDPWSYIGATRFSRAAATYTILTGEPVAITLRAHLVEPEVVSAGRPLMAALAERLGGTDQAELLNIWVRGAARITGIDLNFEDAVEANSFDAWRLLTWADEAGPGSRHHRRPPLSTWRNSTAITATRQMLASRRSQRHGAPAGAQAGNDEAACPFDQAIVFVMEPGMMAGR